MKNTKEKARQSSLIHQRIRNAEFVNAESEPNKDRIEDTKKFKYNLILGFSNYIKNKFIALKNVPNKILQKTQLWLNEVDFIAVREDTSMYLLEALVEGFLINYIVWALMGWRFNLITLLAWGFAIKQFLSIYGRLRKNGTTNSIPKKD